MEQSCQKCGAEAGAGAAFCPKCGAVLGMGDATRAAAADASDEWEMASTFIGKKPGTAPLSQRPRVTAEHAAGDVPARPSAYAPAAQAATARARGGNTLLFAVLGFVAVLLAGGLLILLLYMNSRG